MSDSVGIGCGCVLVQFGRKHLKKKISSCGFSNVRFLDEGTIRNLDVENVTGYEPKFVADIVQKGLMRSVKNYGDLKKIVFEVIQ